MPAKIQPTLAYSSEEKLSIPLVAFSGFQMEHTDYTRTQRYFACDVEPLCHQSYLRSKRFFSHPALWPENGAGLRVIQRSVGHAYHNDRDVVVALLAARRLGHHEIELNDARQSNAA
jgi:hypothetical protein